MMPRVLFLDHTGALGGAELYLLDLVEHRADESHVVLFGEGPFVHRLQEAGVKVEVLARGQSLSRVTRGGGLASATMAVPSIVALVRRVAVRARQCDVVFANSQKALVVGSIAARLARRPLVWSLHDILTADHFSEVNRKVAVVLANRFAEQVIVNSHATARAFHDAGGSVDKTSVVYNGINVAPFADDLSDEVDSLRKDLRLAHNFTVGVFGRLASWKGQHILLEALPLLPDVHALIVGDALFGEEHYARSLRDQTKYLSLTERVHFLGFRHDVPALMKCCDAVVHTSTSAEPFGRVIVEGMLAQRPVVATRAGGATEVIEHGKSGLLTEPGNVDELAQAIRFVMDNTEAAARLAEYGRRRAVQTFSLDAMVAEISLIIDAAACYVRS